VWIGAYQSTYKKGFPCPFFDHRARLLCSGRPASAVLVPKRTQLPQWLYAVLHFSKALATREKPDRLKKPVRFEVCHFGESRNPIFGKNRISKAIL
jgi:hypothetical protein